MFRGVLVCWLALVAASVAQLTFSTDWGNGKRSEPPLAPLARLPQPPDACLQDDALYAILRLIQREAERFLVCQTEGKN